MSYILDPENGDIVIGGWANGVGASPYSGLTDMRSVNPLSIPGEVSDSFSTKSVIKAPSATITSTTGTNLLLIPTEQNIESYQWITFTSVGGSGLSTNTPYFLFFFGTSGGNYEYQLYSTFKGVSPVSITTGATVTFSTIVPGLPKFFQKSKSNNFMLDSNGRVWSDLGTTGTGGGPTTSSWVYIGNLTDTSSNGNGLLLFTTVHNATGGSGSGAPPTFDEWLFVWRNSQIDYTPISSGVSLSTIAWTNGWNYQLTTGTTTGHTNYLNTASGVNNPHPTLVTPDSRANFLDGNFIGNFYQNVPSGTGTYVGFNPSVGGTWTPQTITAVMPVNEVGQCLAFVNTFLLVGGLNNIIYPWDILATDNTYSTPLIMLPETGIANIVTVGNNGYIFAGNRGNIYITNGSQASPYKKVPDHISGQIEPLFTWGGATFNKKRLYFGIQATNQAGGTMPAYGGVWCIDLDSGALWNCNQLSYGTYEGYTSAIGVVGNSGVDGASPSVGYGLVMGWSDGVSPTYGVDISIASPYTGGQSWITSDLIPVGTLLQLMTPTQVELKLSTPLVSGESIQIKIGSYLDMSYASFVSVGTMTYSATGQNLAWNSSSNGGFPIENLQWCILQAILTSVASNPSYNRITELRIIGATAKVTSYSSLE